MKAEPRLPEPEPFPSAGPGAAGIFYPETESGWDLIYSPDPESSVELRKISPAAGIWSWGWTILPGAEVRDTETFCLVPQLIPEIFFIKLIAMCPFC